MYKKTPSEQFEKLDIDMAEELEARIETRGWRPSRSSYSNDQISTSHAIIIGAIIIVVGLWGGKLAYDYHQEQQVKRALNDFTNAMQQSFNTVDNQLARSIEDQRAQQQQQSQIREQQARRANQIAAEQRTIQARNERLGSDQCRFWRDQVNNEPSERNLRMAESSCI